MRRLLKGGILLIGLMLVFGLAACKGDPESPPPQASGVNTLSTITVTDPGDDAATIENATAISKATWDALEDIDDIEGMGIIDFDGVTGGAGFILTATPGHSKATLTYAIASSIPADGAFGAVPADGVTVALYNGSYVFFKIVAENKSTAYYAFEVTGLGGGQASNVTTISAVNINSFNMAATAANRAADIDEVVPASLSLSFDYSTAEVTLTLTKGNVGQTVNWAVTATDASPAEVTGTMTNTVGNTFNAVIASAGLANGGGIWVKVIAANGDIMYYGWTVSIPMNNTTISAVKVGGGANAPVTAAADTLSDLNTPEYTVAVSAATTASLELTRENGQQKIFWTKAASKPADDTGFTEITATAFADNAATVTIPGGVADGDFIIIKVLAADGTTVKYYGWEMSVGGEAVLLQLKLGSSEHETGLWGTGFATFAELIAEDANVVEPEDDQTPSGYSVSATVNDGATVTFFYSATELTSEPNFGPLTQQFFTSESNLYIKVVSPNGKTTRYYWGQIIPPAVAFVFYGQPKIQPVLVEVDDTATNFWERYEFDEDLLDPLWDETDWNIQINRRNTSESTNAPYPFGWNNTVDGTGTVEGRAKVFWDDNGLYVYGEMTYHDYYENQTAKDAGTVTDKVTRQSITGITANSNEHQFDSLEVFTNERLQTRKSGNYGVQFRVSPCATVPNPPTGALAPRDGTYTVVSGDGNNSIGIPTNPITVFRNSEKYFTWIRYDAAGKELGYSCLMYIPWMFKKDAAGDLSVNTDATDVFDIADGMVKTVGNDEGPEVGVEFQLNVGGPVSAAIGSGRACVLTWNGVTTGAYQQCGAYGKFNLVTGDLAGRGITRGEFDDD